MQCYGRIPVSPLSCVIRFFFPDLSPPHPIQSNLSIYPPIHPTSRAAYTKKFRDLPLPPPPASAVLFADFFFFVLCQNCLTFLERTSIAYRTLKFVALANFSICMQYRSIRFASIGQLRVPLRSAVLVLISDTDRGRGVTGMTKHKRREMQDCYLGCCQAVGGYRVIMDDMR